MTGLVLLTGATGFVGRQVYRSLLNRGMDVRVVIREGRLPEFLSSSDHSSVVTTPDLFGESEEWWASVCNGVDTVMHIAWYAKPGEYLESSINIDCMQGTFNLSKGVILAGVRRFVGVGTCLEYDVSKGDLSIDTPLSPTSIYAASKAATYMALRPLLKHAGVEFAWCRLFYLFGEGEDKRRLVPYLHEKLGSGQTAKIGNGECLRDYLDVAVAGDMMTDVAAGSVQGPVNICSGRATSIRQLAEAIADEYGRRDLLEFNDRSATTGEPGKIVGIV